MAGSTGLISFADMVNRRDIGFEIYAEVYTYLSFGKITGMGWSLARSGILRCWAG